MSLEQVDVLDPRWAAFVSTHPQANAFHEPMWTRLLAECYGYRPFALALLGSDGVEAGFPVLEISKRFSKSVRWVSLPFTDSCAPLAAGPAAQAELLGQLDDARAAAGVERLELRAEVPVDGAATVGEAFDLRVDLGPDEESVRGAVHSSQRRNIRHAEREGVVVRRAESRVDLDRTFFEMQLETRRRLGVPVQPRRFYSLLWQHMIETGHGYLLLAYAGTTPVAGTVVLESHGHLTYKFGASSQARWRLRANSLLLWSVIQNGCRSGATSLDLGRTETRHAGLLAFKRQWSTSERPLKYTVLGRVGSSSSSGLASAAAPVIRHSPPVVCRLLGDVFYKYAG